MAAVAFLAMAIPVSVTLRSPPTVAFTLANPHEWNVGVDIILDDGSLVGVTTVEEDSTQVVEEVLRPGRLLRFRWTFEGDEILVTTVTNEQLRDVEHRVTVPEELARRLRAAGAPSSP